mgnify:CR=1 FL=1
MNLNNGIHAEEIKRLCRRLKLNPKKVSVKSLSGGLSNRGFLFSCHKKNWMVRLPKKGQKSQLKVLDVSIESRLLKVVANAGITPALFFDDKHTGALVTFYIENAISWNAQIASQPENLKRIATTLRTLHSIKLDFTLPSFRPAQLCEKFLDILITPVGSRVRKLRKEQKSWQEEFATLAKAYEKKFPPITLCHHDLTGTNILDAQQLWLVDFEYAVQAHPILDIASLSALNALSMQQSLLLVESYYGEDPVPFSKKQLNEVIRLEKLIAYFWALTQINDEDKNSKVSYFADSMAAMLR